MLTPRCVGIGVFLDYYKTHQLQDLPTSTVTWITSLEIFMMFFGVRTLSSGVSKSEALTVLTPNRVPS